jgi:hypothetical protein
MEQEKNIGTKVRITFENGTMSDKDYTIISRIPYNEAKDWCDHLIVRDEDGEEKEIREYSCVFPPDESAFNDCRIASFLDKNGVWGEVYDGYNGLPVVAVSISWGDWKHSHLWCKTLMGYLGYNQIGERVTEENGSDCYSSEHYYIKRA